MWLVSSGQLCSQAHKAAPDDNIAGNSGIGIETVRALCKAGFNVVLACRSTAKGDAVQKELEIEEGKHKQYKISIFAEPSAHQTIFGLPTDSYLYRSCLTHKGCAA